MDYFTRSDIICRALSELSGEQVLNYLTEWHGTQLLDEGFYQYLVGEGVIEDEDEDEDEGANNASN
ncbi:MAG: hypothetical protein PHW03_09735 [Eubacteriales bacterium]|nr:hypothetical protein [Eubacteriales bacterium]